MVDQIKRQNLVWKRTNLRLYTEKHTSTYTFFSAWMKKRVKGSERNKTTETQRTQTEGTVV